MIFYFTATGNSKFIAEKIAFEIGERLINITYCIQEGRYTFELEENETIGFVVPVYFWGLPIIVAELKDRQPVWTIPQCELCMACLHRCPVKAIKYGKQRTHQGHYINPMTKL